MIAVARREPMASTPTGRDGGTRGATQAAPETPRATVFKAILREASLSDRVSQEIEGLIVSGKLAAGDRLPSERELGDKFGVSRTVIREAVRALGAKGLLDVRTGDGTYVTQVSSSSAAEALSRLLRLTGADSPAGVRSLYELRRPLEVAIAALAAERATAEQIVELRRAATVIQDPALPVADFIAADVRFHALLAQATGNHLFSALLESVNDLMGAIRQLGTAVPGSRKDACHHHDAIWARVAAHDAAGARRAMEAHMDASEAIFEKAVAASRR
jgi:GntR family transcriptional repressor for pyruvate dehydrogenase complex